MDFDHAETMLTVNMPLSSLIAESGIDNIS
jgi:hypothetical protein